MTVFLVFLAIVTIVAFLVAILREVTLLRERVDDMERQGLLVHNVAPPKFGIPRSTGYARSLMRAHERRVEQS